jgi:hypothetical protein
MKQITTNTTKLDEELFYHNPDEPIMMCSNEGLYNIKHSDTVVAKKQNLILFKSYNMIPNIYHQLSSHRCEAHGILSGITIIYKLYTQHKSQLQNNSIQVLLRCDNSSVINTINILKSKQQTLKTYYTPDADIIITMLDVRPIPNTKNLEGDKNFSTHKWSSG